MILACTDGFNNAFKSNRDFESTASDFYQRLKTLEGQIEVKRDLHSWLDEFSDFSGDDVTVGLLFKDQIAEGRSKMPRIILVVFRNRMHTHQ